jgi:oxygen-dependent protoporphyrinogen oxidase
VKRVVVIGGGIAGLSTAHALLQRGADVTVLERSARLGGNIITERTKGFTIDGGPDSWVATKPHATELAKSLGVELIPTIEAFRKVYVAHEGTLHPVPEGLILGVPTRILPVLKTGLFSTRAKLRMGLEPLLPSRPLEGDEDESVSDFVSRRLGHEVTDRLAAPLLGGIFAGDASQLSIRATFPQFVEMERRFGSLVRAMRASRPKTSSGKHPSAFLSPRGGMGELIEVLEKALGGRVLKSQPVRALRKDDGRYRIDIDGRDPLFADAVVLGLPAHHAAETVKELDAQLSEELKAIRYASTSTVFLAFRAEAIKRPLDATGFIVPRSMGRPILACTWVSSKWEGRAPAGHVLIRAFFGGAWGEAILEQSDEGLVACARDELRQLMNLDAEPLFTRVFRFDRASPQPVIGHLGRMARIRGRLAESPGLYLVGGGYDGVGIPDCVRQAGETAARIKGD